MIALHRARVVMVAAIFTAVMILVFEFPLRQLISEHSSLASVTTQLKVTESDNAALRADTRALQQQSAIAAIAHEDYGLVDAGQISYVILPGPSSGAKASQSIEDSRTIPPADLVPSASTSSAPVSSATRKSTGQGLWGKVTQYLEFWH